MYSRIVSMRLKPNTKAEFTRLIENEVLPILRKQKGFHDEITFVGANGTDAIGISFWDTKENAEAYQRASYKEVIQKLDRVVEGNAEVEVYEVATSTAHKIARAA